MRKSSRRSKPKQDDVFVGSERPDARVHNHREWIAITLSVVAIIFTAAQWAETRADKRSEHQRLEKTIWATGYTFQVASDTWRENYELHPDDKPTDYMIYELNLVESQIAKLDIGRTARNLLEGSGPSSSMAFNEPADLLEQSLRVRYGEHEASLFRVVYDINLVDQYLASHSITITGGTVAPTGAVLRARIRQPGKFTKIVENHYADLRNSINKKLSFLGCAYRIDASLEADTKYPTGEQCSKILTWLNDRFAPGTEPPLGSYFSFGK